MNAPAGNATIGVGARGPAIRFNRPRRFFPALILAAMMIACAQPVPADKLDYVGEWKSKEMYLLILKDGSVKYERLKGGATTRITGPLKEFQGDHFIVGFSFITTTFLVTQPPYQEAGKWKMVVDGVELTKTR
ncbi:MAG: hypothetical protein PVG78_11150 [Desulfobacterales bacterium]